MPKAPTGPPAVTKQSPNGAHPKPTAPAGSLLSAAVPVGQLVDPWVHMLLYGKNRIGKTTLACEFPKPLLVIGCEENETGGAKSVKGRQGVYYAQCLDAEGVRRRMLAPDVRALLLEIYNTTDYGGYQTFVLDNATALEELVLMEVCGWQDTAVMLRVGNKSKVSTDQYTERSERLRTLVRPLMSFRRHVVVLANEKDHNPQEGRKSAIARGPHTESFYAAKLGGGTATWIQDQCDFVCQLYLDKEMKNEQTEFEGTKIDNWVETGNYVRRLRTEYHQNYAAGVRIDKYDPKLREKLAVIPPYIEATDEERTPRSMYENFMKMAAVVLA